MNIIYFIASSWLLACLSGVFYRLGGASPSDYPKAPKWLVKGVTRDIGCTLCAVVQLGLAVHWFALDLQWWQWAGYTAMSWWGCKSYWSWVNDIKLKLETYSLIHSLNTILLVAFQYRACESTVNFMMSKAEEVLVSINEKEEFYANKHWWNWLLVGITMWSRWLWVTPWGLIPLAWNAWCIMDHSEQTDRVEEEEFGRGFLMII